jgi:hypothetical protein
MHAGEAPRESGAGKRKEHARGGGEAAEHAGEVADCGGEVEAKALFNRDMRLAARLMLALEGLSALAILLLLAAILAGLGHAGALSAAPFHPAQEFGGWLSCVLSLVLLETLQASSTQDDHRYQACQEDENKTTRCVEIQMRQRRDKHYDEKNAGAARQPSDDAIQPRVPALDWVHGCSTPLSILAMII